MSRLKNLGVLVAINPSWLAGVDKPTSEWARDLGAHDFFATATEIGSTYLWIPLVLVFAAALWRRCRSFAFTLPIVLASAMVVDFVLKLIVDRPRPPNTLISTGLSSYPSGHVIVAVAMLGLLLPSPGSCPTTVGCSVSRWVSGRRDYPRRRNRRSGSD